jgi:ligand-binding sensor domain-containing protein
MWLGTADGLNRYDGYDFKVFRPADAGNSSLGDIHINAITAKNNHELWICTDMGIYTFDFLLQDGLKDILLDRISVLTLVEDNQKNVWFGTNKGLYKYNPADSSMSLNLADVGKSSGLSSNYINVLFLDSEFNLWIGTKNGLYLFDQKTGTIITPAYSPIDQSLSGTDVVSICEDDHQRLWIATSQNGLHLLVRKTETQIQLKKVLEGVVTSLLTDDQNNLWIGGGTGEE